MEKYLDYLYCVQKPEKVYLGLDLFQFSNQWYKFSPKSFSETRLDKIKASGRKKEYFNSKNNRVFYLCKRNKKY